MTIVSTTIGTVRGSRRDGIQAFRGIPYATAGRFGAPVAAAPWTGELEATRFGPIAPQAGGAQFQRADLVQDEDCLSLNVWVPAAPADEPRPVMVWIHGGAFVQGSGASPLYDGETLARHGDVVVITINYRIGALGFLAHPDLEGAGGTRGNWGLLDQLAALHWVRDNAAAFGGDPANVTIFGESAGAVSVALLCASPLADGLFHKAVVQSGAPVFLSFDRATELTERLVAALELDRVSELAGVPVPRLLSAQAGISGANRLAVMAPCLDGVVLDRPPSQAVSDDTAAHVPMIVGTNVDEWKLFAPADPRSRDLDDDGLRRRVERRIPDATDEVIATFREARRARGEAVEPRDLWFAIESERYFRVPALRFADAQAGVRPATFTYLFGWGSPGMKGWLGACHGLEIAFVFGNQGRGELAAFTGQGSDADQLSRLMMDAWLAFARTGSPSTAGLEWAHHDSGTRPTMYFDAVSRLEHAPREQERAVIDRALPV